MKKIAITQRLMDNDLYEEKREALDIQYLKFIDTLGFLPVVLSYEVDFEKYFNEIEIGGVVLTGGNDLNSCNPNKLSLKRDTYELKLLKYCIDKSVPVFGICRGMQLIAVYFGSSLKRVDNQVNIRHKIKTNENSKYRLYLDQLNQVNSFHNFAIDYLSDDLLACATNKDNGLIKAIEHKKHRIFAQMWHSERENPFNLQEIELMQAFFSFKGFGKI